MKNTVKIQLAMILLVAEGGIGDQGTYDDILHLAGNANSNAIATYLRAPILPSQTLAMNEIQSLTGRGSCLSGTFAFYRRTDAEATNS